MGYVDLYKFIQAIYPCVQQNYPQLISGVTQLIGGASVIYKLFQMYAPSTTSPGSTGVLSSLVGLFGKIGLSK
jgi:hypothetical protein